MQKLAYSDHNVERGDSEPRGNECVQLESDRRHSADLTFARG